MQSKLYIRITKFGQGNGQIAWGAINILTVWG